jgi:flagellar hook assembly protein FlgD
MYDLLGQQVRSLINAEQTTGIHQIHWDGKNESGEPVASGLYLYKMKTNDFVAMKKLMLLK